MYHFFFFFYQLHSPCSLNLLVVYLQCYYTWIYSLCRVTGIVNGNGLRVVEGGQGKGSSRQVSLLLGNQDRIYLLRDWGLYHYVYVMQWCRDPSE